MVVSLAPHLFTKATVIILLPTMQLCFGHIFFFRGDVNLLGHRHGQCHICFVKETRVVALQTNTSVIFLLLKAYAIYPSDIVF